MYPAIVSTEKWRQMAAENKKNYLHVKSQLVKLAKTTIKSFTKTWMVIRPQFVADSDCSSNCSDAEMFSDTNSNMSYDTNSNMSCDINSSNFEVSTENPCFKCQDKDVIISRKDKEIKSLNATLKKLRHDNKTFAPALRSGPLADKLQRIERELSELNQQLDNFTKRGRNNELKPEMIEYILSSVVEARLSYRQMTSTANSLKQHVKIFNFMEVPNKTSVAKVVDSLPVIHCRQYVDFVQNSTVLSVATDGSTKKNRRFYAVIVINETGSHLALPGCTPVDGCAETDSQTVIDLMNQVAMRAEELKFIPNGQEFARMQFKKIGSLMGDSCNTALLTKKLLGEKIRKASDNDAQQIESLDCG